jgi:FtsP/CotA-like multicopper oxidase with cupredoxin domain
MPPGSTIKFLTRPTDFTGKFVFHCHMTFHEDHGMMGVVKVIAPSG